MGLTGLSTHCNFNFPLLAKNRLDSAALIQKNVETDTPFTNQSSCGAAQSLSVFSFLLSLCLFLSMSINVTFMKLFDMQMTKSACLKTTRGRVSTQEQVVCFDFLDYDSGDHNVAPFMSCDFYHISLFFTGLAISEKI